MFSQASKPGVVLPYMTCALARGTDQTTPFPGPPFFPSPRLVNCYKAEQRYVIHLIYYKPVDKY